MKSITILITDDHTLVRETWSYILNSDSRFNVVGECGSGEEAVELVQELQPDVVIMDINLPGINGIEATRLIRKLVPATRVLGVSVHSQVAYVRKMIQAGAMGYVTKNSTRPEMFKAIEEIHSGRKYICEEIKNLLSERMISGGGSEQTGLDSLTQRELEIIEFIRKGNSSKEIAESLHLSVKTVEVHRYNILKKLNLHRSSELIEFINKHLPPSD
ncbi:response regulator transcription factor [Paraflavisolibacter sp. H34]|uniref:response regulator transcription factor n=1 Tax=Huijunlia imazamoxiresistens TaxID=3127457 RepID=UPI003019B6A2